MPWDQADHLRGLVHPADRVEAFDAEARVAGKRVLIRLGEYVYDHIGLLVLLIVLLIVFCCFMFAIWMVCPDARPALGIGGGLTATATAAAAFIRRHKKGQP